MANDAKYKTAGELENAIRVMTITRVGVNRLSAMGKVIGEIITQVAGDNPETVLTTEARGQLNSTYSKIVEALKAVR